jgi:hypothetical protein
MIKIWPFAIAPSEYQDLCAKVLPCDPQISIESIIYVPSSLSEEDLIRLPSALEIVLFSPRGEGLWQFDSDEWGECAKIILNDGFLVATRASFRESPGTHERLERYKRAKR